VNRLRNRLILVFLAATLAPLGATIWVTTTLLKFNPNYSAVRQLDTQAASLRNTGRELYQRARADLKGQAEAGQLAPVKYTEAGRAAWPAPVREFADSGAAEKFAFAGHEGDQLDYLVRRNAEVWLYSTALGVGMDRDSRYVGGRGRRPCGENCLSGQPNLRPSDNGPRNARTGLDRPTNIGGDGL